MKKYVPDPPFHQRLTRRIPITQCPEHDALYCIEPGIRAEDALMHAVEMMKFAQLTCTLSIEAGEGLSQEYARCTRELMDMSKGLLDSLLEEVSAPRAEA